MSDPRHAVVFAVFDAFRAAIRDRDASAAESLCTSDGWHGRGDAAGRFFRRVARAGQVPDAATDLRINGARAAVKFDDALAETRYGLLERDESSAWRMVALPAHPARAGLFLAGTLDATHTVRDLPPSEEAAAWARRFIGAGAHWHPETWPDHPDALAAVEKLRALAAEPGVRVDRLGDVDLPGLDRGVAGLRFTRRGSDAVDEVWVVLEREPHTRRLAVRALAWVKELDAFLEGVALPWTGDPADDPDREEEEEAPIDGGEGPGGFSAAQLDRLLAAAMGRLHEAGADASSRDLAEDVRRRFRDRLRRGAGPRIEEAPAEAAPRPVQVDLGGAVRDYLAERGEPAGEVVVDRDFLAAHGKGLLGSMLGAFTRAFAPERVGVEAGAALDQRARVEVDVVDLVAGLLPAEAAPADGKMEAAPGDGTAEAAPADGTVEAAPADEDEAPPREG